MFSRSLRTVALGSFRASAPRPSIVFQPSSIPASVQFFSGESIKEAKATRDAAKEVKYAEKAEAKEAAKQAKAEQDKILQEAMDKSMYEQELAMIEDAGLDSSAGFEVLEIEDKMQLIRERLADPAYVHKRYENRLKVQQAAEKYRRHIQDTGSPEAQCAQWTERIVQLSAHLQQHRKDLSAYRGMIQLIHNRRKLLMYLRRTEPDLVKDLMVQWKIRKIY